MEILPRRSSTTLFLFLFTILAISISTGCKKPEPIAASGVKKATINIRVDPNTGLTTEQTKVAQRLLTQDSSTEIHHLYVIAPKSGKVILYSTVKGKVTSSGKRLSPRKVEETVGTGDDKKHSGFQIYFDGDAVVTEEVLEDDGTYGSSLPYLYWFDVQDRYHQQFITDGQIIRITSQPLVVPSIVINMELSSSNNPPHNKH